MVSPFGKLPQCERSQNPGIIQAPCHSSEDIQEHSLSIECQPLRLKNHSESLGGYDGYVRSINRTNTVWEAPPALIIRCHFSERLPFGNWICSGTSNVIAAAQMSWTYWRTVVILTPKRSAMLLYSEPVASFQSAIATLFIKGTYLRKVLSFTSIAGRSLMHR